MAHNEVPKRFQDRLLTGDVQPSAAREALKSRVDLVVLSGGAGCGKTLAACEWLSERTSPGLFVAAAELARWPRYDVGEMRRLLRSRALAIDDLGTEYMDDKGNFMAVLDEVVNARYADELPTVITTNLSGDAFKARYGERIADRVRESGRFVGLGEESFRRKTTDAEKDGYAARVAEASRLQRDAEPRTCTEHLYGEAIAVDRPCDKRCLYFVSVERKTVVDAVRELAAAKGTG